MQGGGIPAALAHVGTHIFCTEIVATFSLVLFALVYFMRPKKAFLALWPEIGLGHYQVCLHLKQKIVGTF